MKEIARFLDAHEAKLAKGYLRSLGFDAMLPEENHFSVEPSLAFGFGGYRVLVPHDEAFVAQAALKEIRPDMPKPSAFRATGAADGGRAPVSWRDRSANRPIWKALMKLRAALAGRLSRTPTSQHRSTRQEDETL